LLNAEQTNTLPRPHTGAGQHRNVLNEFGVG